MSSDFLSRVLAEARRRIEEEHFETAVVAEMRRLREEERREKQVPIYHAFHEMRKAKLHEACDAGRISKKIADIEIAVSEYVLGDITLDDVYAVIEAVDRNYPQTYVQSAQGRRIVYMHAALSLRTPARPGVPIGFQMYLERALGHEFTEAREKQTNFNSITMMVM